MCLVLDFLLPFFFICTFYICLLVIHSLLLLLLLFFSNKTDVIIKPNQKHTEASQFLEILFLFFSLLLALLLLFNLFQVWCCFSISICMYRTLNSVRKKLRFFLIFRHKPKRTIQHHINGKPFFFVVFFILIIQ